MKLCDNDDKGADADESGRVLCFKNKNHVKKGVVGLVVARPRALAECERARPSLSPPTTTRWPGIERGTTRYSFPRLLTARAQQPPNVGGTFQRKAKGKSSLREGVVVWVVLP